MANSIQRFQKERNDLASLENLFTDKSKDVDNDYMSYIPVHISSED